MARRLSAEEPYTPLDTALLVSVLRPKSEPSPAASSIKEDATTPQTRRRQTRPRMGPEKSMFGSRDPQTSPSSPLEHQRQQPTATFERMNATLRLKVPVSDKREFEAFTARLETALDTTLKPSNLLRAMLTVLQNAEPLMCEAARREAPLKRPPNDDAYAYAEFEHRLVRLMDAAIRQSSPLPFSFTQP